MPQNTCDDKSSLGRLWLGGVRQQAITLANDDTYLCHPVASCTHKNLRASQFFNFGQVVKFTMKVTMST